MFEDGSTKVHVTGTDAVESPSIHEDKGAIQNLKVTSTNCFKAVLKSIREIAQFKQTSSGKSSSQIHYYDNESSTFHSCSEDSGKNEPSLCNNESINPQ